MAMRNSDGSYDAVDSGGFGKDYHGQDAFGENIGGTGVGGNHFGGFESGHFGVGDGRDHFEREANSYADIAQTEVPDTSAFEGEEEVGSAMRDSLRDLNSETTENSNTGSIDTSFQIGGIEEDLDKELQKAAKANDEELLTAGLNLQRAARTVKDDQAALDKVNNLTDKIFKSLEQHKDKTSWKFNDPRSVGDKIEEAADFIENFRNTTVKDVVDLDRMAGDYTVTDTSLSREINKNGIGVVKDYLDKYASTKETYENRLNKSKGIQNDFQTKYDKLKASRSESFKSSFTDKMEPKSTPSKVIEEAVKGPGENMKNAKTSPSDYLTKSNKDSTKEVPKEAPSRNDFGNHAVNTLKGVVDRVADSTTAEALGLKSVEEFAKENGYDPEKLSTMKAYMQYQNKQIMKAIPGIVKQIGSYITERVKDVVDPSQLPERIRNTLARYNLASLIGAAILSMNSGAGLQASLDQALTMVDPEDQAAVSDYLEDVLNDEGTVTDLKTAFDDALAPQQNSDTNELDESIVNIGRKDTTDYSDFNAGLGTTSDKDVKVFITRNVKADPILRKMISKIGK